MDFHSYLYPLNALLIFALACLLGIFLTHKLHLGWSLWLAGAAGFILSQVGHIPFNWLLSTLILRGVLPRPAPQNMLVFNAVVGGLSAGFWEEGVRYALLRWWRQDARTWRQGVLFGAGWGGSEAILLALLGLYTFAQITTLREGDISKLVPPEQLALVQQIVAQYWSAPAYLVLLSFVERAMALVLQVSLAVLVLQAFTRRSFVWVLLAFAYHSLVDAASVYALGRAGPLVSEGVVAGFTVISLFMIFILRQPEAADEPENIPAAPAPLVIPALPAIEETGDNLESTRYNP